MRFLNFFLHLFVSVGLYAVQIPAEHLFPQHSTLQAPWFTGPLLAPSPVNVPAGHLNFEPYITLMADTGRYDNQWKRVKTPTSWSNFFQPSLQIGVNNWLEVDLTPTLFYNYNHGASDWAFGDLPFAFAIQLFKTRRHLDQWNTALRIEFRGVVPFGEYQKLSLRKKGTDSGGQGSWRPGVGLDWGNIFYLGGGHFATWRFDVIYTLPNPVRVQGINSYGGDSRTLGTVYPSQSLLLDTALEISLTQNWVVVMEALGRWRGSRRFKGKTHEPMTNKSGAVFSLAPAIEYNWSSHIGLIFGSWFSIAGRNAPQFASAIVAFNYYQ